MCRSEDDFVELVFSSHLEWVLEGTEPWLKWPAPLPAEPSDLIGFEHLEILLPLIGQRWDTLWINQGGP